MKLFQSILTRPCVFEPAAVLLAKNQIIQQCGLILRRWSNTIWRDTSLINAGLPIKEKFSNIQQFQGKVVLTMKSIFSSQKISSPHLLEKQSEILKRCFFFHIDINLLQETIVVYQRHYQEAELRWQNLLLFSADIYDLFLIDLLLS